MLKAAILKYDQQASVLNLEKAHKTTIDQLQTQIKQLETQVIYWINHKIN